MSITLNGVRCLRATPLLRWRGVWTVDVDIDPSSTPVSATDVPVGPVTLTVVTGNGSTITMNGTVDPNAAGRWMAGVPVRVVGGGNGWDTLVAAQDFQSPSGVSSLAVEQATAALVGETVNDPQPISLGLHWSRTAGPASRVFTAPERDWYVDLTGVTQVGTWPSATPDPSVDILDWDPLQQRATLSTDAIVLPGTVLNDPRFDGGITVRDVELVFDAAGTRATAWCSSVAITRLVSALTHMVRELGALSSMKSFQYRIVSQSGASLTLQAVENPDGTPSEAPDSTNVVVWPGMQGLSAVYKSSSFCRVVFLGASYSNPIVVSFDGSTPTTVTIDASGTVDVGPSANAVNLAGGGNPVARVGDTVYVVGAFTGTVSGAPATGVVTGLGTILAGSGKVYSG